MAQIQVGFHMDVDEHRRFTEEAARQGLKLTAWLRKLGNDAISKREQHDRLAAAAGYAR